MKKLDVAQTLGLLANVGVIAGIIFLAIELRQNNELLGAGVRATRVENQISLVDTLFASPDVVALLGEETLSLTEAELDRIRLLGIRTLIQAQWAFGEAERGFEDLDALERTLTTVFHRDRLNYGVPIAWETWRETADPRFRAWFEANVIER